MTYYPYYPESDDEVVITLYGKMFPSSTGLYAARLVDNTIYYFGVDQIKEGVLGVEKVDLRETRVLEPGVYEWITRADEPTGVYYVKVGDKIIYTDPRVNTSYVNTEDENTLCHWVDKGSLRKVL